MSFLDPRSPSEADLDALELQGCVVCGDAAPDGTVCSRECAVEAERQVTGNVTELRKMAAGGAGREHRRFLTSRNGRLTDAMLTWRPGRDPGRAPARTAPTGEGDTAPTLDGPTVEPRSQTMRVQDLTDADIETVGTAAPAATPRLQDGDATDVRDGDAADADGADADGNDGDATDVTDGDATDGADADGTDA